MYLKKAGKWYYENTKSFLYIDLSQVRKVHYLGEEGLELVVTYYDEGKDVLSYATSEEADDAFDGLKEAIRIENGIEENEDAEV